MTTRKTITRRDARALTEAGYMPVSRYVELFPKEGADDEEAQIECCTDQGTPRQM